MLFLYVSVLLCTYKICVKSMLMTDSYLIIFEIQTFPHKPSGIMLLQPLNKSCILCLVHMTTSGQVEDVKNRF